MSGTSEGLAPELFRAAMEGQAPRVYQLISCENGRKAGYPYTYNREAAERWVRQDGLERWELWRVDLRIMVDSSRERGHNQSVGEKRSVTSHADVSGD